MKSYQDKKKKFDKFVKEKKANDRKFEKDIEKFDKGKKKTISFE